MKNIRLKKTQFRFAGGALVGLLSALAVAGFKGPLSASAILPGLLTSFFCGWSMVKTAGRTERRRCIFAGLLAALFSAFCMLGYCFGRDSTPEWFFAFKTRTLLTFCGYTVVFYLCIDCLFCCLNGRKTDCFIQKDTPAKGYGRLLSVYPFQTAFITLLVLYIPYIIASWPALFMGDCTAYFRQGFGTAPMTTHHPVLFTLFLTGIIKAAYPVFHSWNASAFVFSLLQFLFFISIMAEGIRILVRKAGICWKWAFALLMYYTLSPRISNCMFVITKDVCYAACFLLLGAALFCILREGWTGRNIFRLAIASAGMLSFRKDGIYVLLISFVIYALFHSVLRKKIWIFVVAVFGLSALFNQVLYPAAAIEKGSVKEMLSIPLQQTARCAKYLSDSLSEHEKNEILDIFLVDSIEELGDAYDPNLSDYVKDYKFPADIQGEKLQRYIKHNHLGFCTYENTEMRTIFQD